MPWKLLIILICLAAAVIGPTVFFSVDRTEFVYLTQFGRRIATFDGENNSQAGLHVKWPWPVQTVQRLDRRLQFFDLPGAELLTRDPKGDTIDKTLTIDAYVCWRIPNSAGADLFVRSVGTADRAQQVLGQRIASELGSAIAGMELSELINTEPGAVERDRRLLRDRLLDQGSPSLRQSALAEYGIDVVDIRLRRTNHPPAVREAIFERIRSERAKKVADYQSEGERLAANIRSQSEREVSDMKAAAEARAIAIRGQANAEADRIRNLAQAKDPQFYSFLRKLEEYQRILGDNKTTLLLSTHRNMFDLLFNPPVLNKAPPGTGREAGKKDKPPSGRDGGAS
jgi:membrane protease subunit HflC